MATPFEFRPPSVELQLCQRYCVLYAQGSSEAIGICSNWTSTNHWCAVRMPVPMRSTPTMSATSGTNYWMWRAQTISAYSDTILDPAYTGGANLGNIIYKDPISTSISGPSLLGCNNAGCKLLYTAEL